MSYEVTDFYERYASYLKEPLVRSSHDKVFKFFNLQLETSFSIADLGCGLGEYYQYGYYNNYAGIDASPILPSIWESRKPKLGFDRASFHSANYRDFDFSALAFVPDTFISLFSIEACYSCKEKYSFYHKLFATLPITKALVSGFYYRGRENEEIVSENGDLRSYQTIELSSSVISEVFSETRIEMPVPSKLFGSEVVEVWKILTKRS